jgi:hypothetical protein
MHNVVWDRHAYNHDIGSSTNRNFALNFLANQITNMQAATTSADGLIPAIHVGSRDVAGDLLVVTKKMRDDGVRQYGEQTTRLPLFGHTLVAAPSGQTAPVGDALCAPASLVWGQEPGERVVSVTTGLHESQEQEFIQLARAAAEDRSAALPAGLLWQQIEQSGLDFTGSHGAAQRRTIEHLVQGGRFGLAIAAAGRCRQDGSAEASRGRVEGAGQRGRWRSMAPLSGMAPGR